MNPAPSLKAALERLYARYNRRGLIAPDPLQFVYRYSDPRDMEIAGFLASSLAYGRVAQIAASVSLLLGLMGPSPYRCVLGFDARRAASLKGFRHRFTSGASLAALMGCLKKALSLRGSIEGFFLQGYDAGERDIVPSLARFRRGLLAMREGSSKGLDFLLPAPEAGSACKRLNLFLRWMVRKDGVDPGLWKSVDKAKLIVPADVHMARLCRLLKLYRRKTISLAAAVEMTAGFRRLEPGDPVKYDFALSRVGILENCTGRHREGCRFCALFRFCKPL
ncbi:MAG: TIGR02757 family protein [Elusimicrobia bacterium]|nr:TIGR02757 family protein [Elusimicrobiota bacterium]